MRETPPALAASQALKIPGKVCNFHHILTSEHPFRCAKHREVRERTRWFLTPQEPRSVRETPLLKTGTHAHLAVKDIHWVSEIPAPSDGPLHTKRGWWAHRASVFEAPVYGVLRTKCRHLMHQGMATKQGFCCKYRLLRSIVGRRSLIIVFLFSLLVILL